MFPKRFEPFLNALFLSGAMSCLVSGIATARAVPIDTSFPGIWLSTWIFAWAVAFPTLLICRPWVQRLTARLVRDEA